MKKLISIIASVALVASMGVTAMAASRTTNISGSYNKGTTTCSLNTPAGGCSNITLCAECCSLKKGLSSKTGHWDNLVMNVSVSKWNLLAVRGYFIGYYYVNDTMYYNDGYVI